MWLHRWVVLAAGVAGLLAGIVLAQLQSPVYEASSLLRLADPETAGVFESQEAGAEVYMARREDLATSRDVMERAAEILGSGVSAGEVRRSISVEADPDLLTLRIQAQRDTGQASATFANSVAEAYQQVARERTFEQAEKVISELRTAEASLEDRTEAVEEQLADLLVELREAEATALQERIAAEQQGVPLPAEPDIPIDPRTGLIAARLDNLVAQLVEVESRIREVVIDAEVVGSGVENFEEATVPDTPSAPRPLVLALVGGMFAIGLAGAFAYWRAGHASRVWSSADVTRILRAPLLGRLPVVHQAPPVDLPEDLDLSPRVTEAYQFLLNSIEYELTRIGGSSILVTSAGATQGKTTACVHLALAAGRARERDIVLLDGDLRARSLTRLLNGTGHAGLSELASEDVGPVDVMLRRPITPDVSVWAVPAGEGAQDPSFLRSPMFHEAIWKIRHGADLTVVDSAPLLAVADTTVLAGHVDGVVLIVNDRAPTAELERVRERLSFVSAPLLGYVYVSGRAGEQDHYGYYYGDAPRRGIREHVADTLRRTGQTHTGGEKPAPATRDGAVDDQNTPAEHR